MKKNITDNKIVIIHYDKNNPEAYVWWHKDEYILYKKWVDEQEKDFAKSWFKFKQSMTIGELKIAIADLQKTAMLDDDYEVIIYNKDGFYCEVSNTSVDMKNRLIIEEKIYEKI